MNKQRLSIQSVKNDTCANSQSFGSKKENDIVYIIIGIVLYNYIYSYTTNILEAIFILIPCLLAFLALLALCLKIWVNDTLNAVNL